MTVAGTSSTAILSMKKASGGLTKQVLITRDVLSDSGKFIYLFHIHSFCTICLNWHTFSMYTLYIFRGKRLFQRHPILTFDPMDPNLAISH